MCMCIELHVFLISNKLNRQIHFPLLHAKGQNPGYPTDEILWAQG
jgi:hypothetical protein